MIYRDPCQGELRVIPNNHISWGVTAYSIRLPEEMSRQLPPPVSVMLYALAGGDTAKIPAPLPVFVKARTKNERGAPLS